MAKVVYGLVSTGVLELKVPASSTARGVRVPTPQRGSQAVAAMPSTDPPSQEDVDDLERGFACLQRGDFNAVVKAWAQYLQTHPTGEWSERVRFALDAAARLRGLLEERYGD